MQDKINCNKINDMRKERMQTHFYTGLTKSVLTSSTQTTHLRFFTPFVKIRLQSLNYIGTTLPCVQHSLQLKNSRSFNQSHWMRRKKEEFSLEEKDITIEVHEKTLNEFSKCLSKSFFLESIWQWSSLGISLSYILCLKSSIYRPLMTIQKSLEQMWLSEVIFWRVVTLENYFLNFWILHLDQTWEALIFGIIKIMYTYIHNLNHRQGSDGDGIGIFASSNVWIDHCFLARCADGLIDVIHASTSITISNNYFTQHDRVSKTSS